MVYRVHGLGGWVGGWVEKTYRRTAWTKCSL